MNAIGTILASTLPGLVAALFGGLLAAWRPPSVKITAVIQHLAAGIVIAATSLELLPKERTEATAPVVLGFGLGIVLMLGIRALSRRFESADKSRKLPIGLLVVTALDLVIDGLVLGMAFATGEKTGMLLAAALTLEVLFIALSVSTAVARAGAPKLAVIALAPGLVLLLIVSALCGLFFFGGLPPFAFALVLGVGIVALLYLVTEELLVEAHEVEETSASIAAFFMGFLAFLVLEMAVETAL